MAETSSSQAAHICLRRAARLAGPAVLLTILFSLPATVSYAQNVDPTYRPGQQTGNLTEQLFQWITPEKLDGTLQTLLLLGVVSLAPAIFLMTTCFVRIMVVLGLLRAALGIQTLPSSQVITSLALFMSLAVMTPVWKQVYDEGIAPYTEHEKTLEEAWTDGVQPIRRFMSLQIEATGNQEDIWLFLKYMPQSQAPENYEDVPLSALLPAFMLSELKTAFLIGFQIFIPFLILDMVVASVTLSMGMVMVPPTLLSLPFKLLLFVLLDGWQLIVGMLMESFQPFL